MGNLASQLVSFLFIPLYTTRLSTTQYGTVDILMTTASLLLPLVSLSIYESVLRFVMERTRPREAVLTTAVTVTIVGAGLLLVTSPLVLANISSGGTYIYLYVILILQMFQAILAQFARAIGKVRLYATNGLVQALVLAVSNIVMLVVFDLGVHGYLISVATASVASIVLLSLGTSALREIDTSALERGLAKDMLKYSMPLIPNVAMWWLVSVGSRYFIVFYWGLGTAGIFAIASKIPLMLSVLTAVFGQAWQLAAIEEYRSSTRSRFYSNAFHYYQALLLLGVSALLVGLKPIMGVLVSEDYYLSWRYVPFLLLATVFSSFASFIGTHYTAAMRTSGALKTSIVGGGVAVAMNVLLVPELGGYGAGVASLMAFCSMWLLRIRDTRRLIEMSYDVRGLISSLGVIAVQTAVLFLGMTRGLETGILCALFGVSLILNRRIFKISWRFSS